MRVGLRKAALAVAITLPVSWQLAIALPAEAFMGDGQGRGDGSFQGGNKQGKFGGGFGGGPMGQAVGNPEVRDAFLPMRATEEAMTARGFFETGLRPVYPDGLDCGTADSFFGVTTRGDGSTRSKRFYLGYHGGLDIPAKGIEILAVADGEVIEKSEGDNIGGTKVILRHSPEDTGFPHWTFTEYKHLKDPSPLAVGTKVTMGTPVGIAWNTGTTGGKAYGPVGHYHLHMSAWYNEDGEFKITPMMVIPKDGYWLDPLAMMRGGPLASADANALGEDEKRVRFAYKTSDGQIHPSGAKIIWPFACQ